MSKIVSINHTFKSTFSTTVGEKCLQHLKETFVDREIALAGMDLLQIGIRQGEANVINKIIKEVEREVE